MRKVIKIRLKNPELLKVTFMMTRNCPYACRYCPASLHEGTHATIDLDSVSKFIEQHSDRNIVFNITGGEPTTHPQFKDLLVMLRAKGVKTIVDTNSVRTERFYKEVGALVDNWCVSLHPSQHTLDLEKIKVLTSISFVVVNVLMDPDNWETSVDWLAQVKTLDNVKINPTKIISDWAGATCNVVYTPGQEQVLLDERPFFNFTETRFNELISTHQWLTSMASVGTREDGTEFEVNYSNMIKDRENIFTGWNCRAGNHAVLIDTDGTAQWANCGIKKYNHLSEATKEELSKELVCTFNSCDCGTDIKSPKEINV